MAGSIQIRSPTGHAHGPTALSKSRCCRGSGLASSGELLRRDKNGSSPRRHPHARLTGSPVRALLNSKQAHGCWRTASGRAYPFARLGISVLCLVIFKGRLFRANYRQTSHSCESLRNNGLTTNIGADPLDKCFRRGKKPCAKRLCLSFRQGVEFGCGQAAFGGQFRSKKGRYGA